MPKFRVSITVERSRTIEVDAEDDTAAFAIGERYAVDPEFAATCADIEDSRYDYKNVSAHEVDR